MKFDLIFRLYGDGTLLIDWPQKIAPDISMDIINFQEMILSKNNKSIQGVIISYASMLVSFDRFTVSPVELESWLHDLYENLSGSSCDAYLWHIPVCYDHSFGLDLDDMTNSIKCSVEEIMKLHRSVSYRVYFIGFLPGFLYLGGLPSILHTPRKKTPGLRIPAGSVGIGGEQTGVYPQESPGGWNIIGRTPISFFDLGLSIPCFARPGDQVRFYPIDLKTYEKIETQVEGKNFEIKKDQL